MARRSGILLHPTSLPGRHGIGDFGPGAYQFIDFLQAAGQSLWQILPLGPTSYGDSPYQCLSAMAGNALLISPERLLQDGLIEAGDVADAPDLPSERVDYCRVTEWKHTLLQRAFARFDALAPAHPHRQAWQAFCTEHAAWLDDFALFCALKQHFADLAWNEWPAPYRQREAQALNNFAAKHPAALNEQRFIQWLFFTQWQAVKHYANAHGIQIIGDMPIFVAYDSADVWANQDLFELDADGRATVVAGVGPDYFSATGQRWGNPLYRWARMAEDDYAWWRERLTLLQSQVDIMRIDHFCGFENYWEIPGHEETAVNGRWRKGPGLHFFQTVKKHLGQLALESRIIAEDLGILTPEVVALREQSGLPGMRVLHYAFGAPDTEYMPRNYIAHCVAYTGTHDNNTTRGWFKTLPEHERANLRACFGRDFTEHEIAAEMTRAVWQSVADTVLIPLQDAFNLDESARMNYPGSALGNWGWRYRTDQLSAPLGHWLADLTRECGRMPPSALTASSASPAPTFPTFSIKQ
jgi:4-alpha-glucanotransferase